MPRRLVRAIQKASRKAVQPEIGSPSEELSTSAAAVNSPRPFSTHYCTANPNAAAVVNDQSRLEDPEDDERLCARTAQRQLKPVSEIAIEGAAMSKTDKDNPPDEHLRPGLSLT